MGGGGVVADQDGEVVFLGLRPALDGVDDAVGGLLGREAQAIREQGLQASLAEFLVALAGGFYDAVGVEDQAVARFRIQPCAVYAYCGTAHGAMVQKIRFNDQPLRHLRHG